MKSDKYLETISPTGSKDQPHFPLQLSVAHVLHARDIFYTSEMKHGQDADNKARFSKINVFCLPDLPDPP